MTDLRVLSALEARECLFRVREQTVDQPEFWANLLGAIANACMAAMPEAVLDGVVAELTPTPPPAQPRVQRRTQRRIKKQLGSP